MGTLKLQSEAWILSITLRGRRDRKQQESGICCFEGGFG